MVLVTAWGNRSWASYCHCENIICVLVKEAGNTEMGYLATLSPKDSSQDRPSVTHMESRCSDSSPSSIQLYNLGKSRENLPFLAIILIEEWNVLFVLRKLVPWLCGLTDLGGQALVLFFSTACCRPHWGLFPWTSSSHLFCADGRVGSLGVQELPHKQE